MRTGSKKTKWFKYASLRSDFIVRQTLILVIIIIIIIIIKLQMCEICKSLHELPWRFLRWMLHVLRHDEWHWHWQKAATLYNQENDKYSHLEQNITYLVVEIGIGIAHWRLNSILIFFSFSSSFLFLFWIIQSQAAFVNCQYVPRFTKFPIITNYLFINLL